MGRAVLLSALAGLVGSIAMIAGLLVDPAVAARAYLAAYLAVLTPALGALFLLMIGHTLRSRWFVVLRRVTEAITLALPALAILFLPVLLLLPSIYPWALPHEQLTGHLAHVVEHKRPWLSPAFFAIRAAVYFAVWIVIAEVSFRWSLEQRREDPGGVRRLRRLGAASLWPLALTLTFAGFDWFMSVDPGFVSTIWGLYLFASGMLGAVAILSIIAGRVKTGELGVALGESHRYALGRLLLTFVILWAYFAFSQLLIVWMADLPEEVPWYLSRFEPPWSVLGVFLIIGRFAIPFFALLSYRIKRRRNGLSAVAGWILLGHAADAAWLVLPSLGGSAAGPLFWFAGGLLAVGGIASAWVFWRIQDRPALAAGDPDLERSLGYVST